LSSFFAEEDVVFREAAILGVIKLIVFSSSSSFFFSPFFFLVELFVTLIKSASSIGGARGREGKSVFVKIVEGVIEATGGTEEVDGTAEAVSNLKGWGSL
jgi:hypothetical protein